MLIKKKKNKVVLINNFYSAKIIIELFLSSITPLLILISFVLLFESVIFMEPLFNEETMGMWLFNISNLPDLPGT